MIRSSSEDKSGRLPPQWREHLREGLRARVHASVERDHTEIPLDLVLHLSLGDANELAIRVELVKASPGDEATRERIVTLTPRERAVTDLVAKGHETAEIARLLHISPATVRTHVRNAMEKVGAHTRAQLVALVLRASRADL